MILNFDFFILDALDVSVAFCALTQVKSSLLVFSVTLWIIEHMFTEKALTHSEEAYSYHAYPPPSLIAGPEVCFCRTLLVSVHSISQ